MTRAFAYSAFVAHWRQLCARLDIDPLQGVPEFDPTAFVRQWRLLCKQIGVDPLEGIPADTTSFGIAMIGADARVATHHARAAAAVYADAKRDPDRTPDDKQDAPTFAQIADARAKPDWYVGVLTKAQPVEEAKPEPARKGFKPRIVTSANPPRTVQTIPGVVMGVATWTALEADPVVRSLRDEREAIWRANKARNGVYHAHEVRRAA